MLDTPRTTGPLELSDPIRSGLAELRLLSGVDVVPELDIDVVRDVERGVGMRLPDDVLALFAAGVPHLEEAHGFTLGSVVAHTGSARALGARGDLVALGRLPDRELFYCLEKGASSGDGTRLLVFDAEVRELHPLELETWLADEVRALRDGLPAPPSFDAGLAVTFQPRLARRVTDSSPGTRVRHKVFGEGRVLRELGKGADRKVQVDFPGKGLKLLQARFLEYLE